MKRLFFAILLTFLSLAGGLFAQSETDLNAGSQLINNGDGTYTFSWWGSFPNTYFILQSDDMIHWTYLPVIETGWNEVIQYGLTSSASSLFLRLRYTDCPWADPYTDDFDGDGVGNWDELLAGTDPLDYYNGVLPTLTLVNGANQRVAAGTTAPVPLCVMVNNGSVNAPLTFTVVSGGALLASSTSSGSATSGSLQLRTTQQYPDASRNMQTVALAYIALPRTPGDVSVIQVTAASETATVSATTTAVATDPSIPAPTNVSVQATSGSTATLSWTSASGLPTTVQVSSDGGVTWSTVQVVAAGGTSATVTGLVANQSVEFCLTSGADSGDGGSTTTGPVTPNAPVPPVQSYAAIDVTGGAGVSGAVGAIALDDSNNGAYAYSNGGAVTAKTWVNGVPGSYTNVTPSPPPITVGSTSCPGNWGGYPYFVTAGGTIYQEAHYTYESGIYNGITIPLICGNSISNPITPVNVFGGDSYDYLANAAYIMLDGASANACFGSTESMCGTIDFGYVCVGGTTTEFVPYGEDSSYTLKKPNIANATGYFCIAVISDNGYAVGWDTCDPYSGLFAGGLPAVWQPGSSSVTDTSLAKSTQLTAINNQGIFIGKDTDGFLWYNGTETALTSLIPSAYSSEISYITPRLISNSDTNGVIQILIDARFTDPSTTISSTNTYVLSGSYASLTRGSWALAQVQLPSGMSTTNIHCINNSGILATANLPADGVSSSPVVGVLLPIDIVPDSGQAGTTGDIVPSIITTGTGQKHYVSPKQASSFVVLKASVPSGFDGANFSKFFEWDTINPDGSTNAAGQAVSGSPDKWQVKRDAPGQYIVRIKTISDHKEVVRMNVWVVWCDGNISHVPAMTITRASDTTIDGTPTTSTVCSSAPSDQWQFTFTVNAGTSSITDITKDIPDLTGNNNPSPAVPGAGTKSPSPPGTSDLAGGANRKWDVSRRYSFPISNPASIPRGKFTSGFGTIYSQSIPSGNAVSLPSDPLIGNDDASTADEDNNPYSVCTNGNLAHAIGQITSVDRPTLWMPDAGGTEGNTLQQSFMMQEFVRVQIGSSWYVVSDPLLWKGVETLKFHNGQWQDNGSTLGAGN